MMVRTLLGQSLSSLASEPCLVRGAAHQINKVQEEERRHLELGPTIISWQCWVKKHSLN